jgi:hypothetical protein
MAGGQFSLSPDKIQQSVQALQGKVSPKMFMDLSDKATKVQENATKYADSLTKLSSDKLKLYTDQTAAAVPVFDEVIKAAEMGSEATGEQSAESKLPALRNQMVQKLKATGMYPDSFLAQVATMDLPALKSARDASAWQKDTVANQYRQAQTDLLKDPKKKEYFGPDGTMYLQTERGQTFKVDQVTGELVRVPGLPQGSTEAVPKAAKTVDKLYSSKEGLFKADAQGKTYMQNQETGEWIAKPMPPDARPLGGKAPVEVKVDLEKDPPTDSEIRQAQTFILTNKLPTTGAGAQAAAAKQRVLAIADREAANMGLDASQVLQLQNKIKATNEGLKRLTTQAAVIRAGEKNVSGALDVLENEVKKLGGFDSPKINKLLNKVYTEWSGDPDFVGINTAYLDVVENAARVYSGATGAGGTPVSFLELAKSSLPANPSLAQVLKLKDVMPKLFEARRKATEDELKALSEGTVLPPKKGEAPAAAAPAAGAAKVSGEGDKKPQADILRKEYDTAVAKVSSAITPQARMSALADARAVRNELKKLGVELPDVSAPTAATATTPAPAAATGAFGSVMQGAPATPAAPAAAPATAAKQPPVLSEWMVAAKAANPKATDAELTAYYKTKYLDRAK